MRARRLVAGAGAAFVALVAAGASIAVPLQERWPVCGPVDSAAALQLRVVDARSNRPLGYVAVSGHGVSYYQSGYSDTLGMACLRELPGGQLSVTLSRIGYRDTTAVFATAIGGTTRMAIAMHRVDPPCCDLRGEWSVRLHLDSVPPDGHTPTARTTSGTLRFGYHADEIGFEAELDESVRTVAGRFDVDLAPFFGGPFARDVSTTIVAGTPEFLTQAIGTIPEGDRVSIVFIPGMSHGGLSLWGRVARDTIRGEWEQNAYSRGASGRFEMVRIAAFDPSKAPPRRDAVVRRPRGTAFEVSPDGVAAGVMPPGSIRPSMGIGPDGSIWFAPSGLFATPSFGAAWRRVLGGMQGPVSDRDMGMSAEIVVLSTDTVIVGMGYRYSMPQAPALYRTTDGGRRWTAVTESPFRAVFTTSSSGRTVYAIGGTHWIRASSILRSDDAGATWTSLTLPSGFYEPNAMALADARTAYVGGGGFDGSKPIWRTTDAGVSWQALPTPGDQGKVVAEDVESHVHQVAIAGNTILVTQMGRVFATDAARIDWREVPELLHVASDAGDPRVLVLDKDRRARLIDASLREIWRTAEPLPYEKSYVQQVRWRNGVGYVSTGHGSLYEIRDGAVRALHKVPATAPNAR